MTDVLQGPEYLVPLEWGKIREFARATKSEQADYARPGAPVTPTFLTTAVNVWEPRYGNPVLSLGFDLRRVLHGEEEFIFHGPPPTAGTDLHVRTRLGECYSKEGKRGGTMRFAEVITEFRDPSGTLVAEKRTTVVETAQAPRDAS